MGEFEGATWLMEKGHRECPESRALNGDVENERVDWNLVALRALLAAIFEWVKIDFKHTSESVSEWRGFGESAEQNIRLKENLLGKKGAVVRIDGPAKFRKLWHFGGAGGQVGVEEWPARFEEVNHVFFLNALAHHPQLVTQKFSQQLVKFLYRSLVSLQRSPHPPHHVVLQAHAHQMGGYRLLFRFR